MSLDLKLKLKDYNQAPAELDARALPDGGLVVGDWLDALVARGLGWHVSVGAFSTPITGGGNGTILDQDQPELVIMVPAGVVLRPVRIHVQCQTPLIAADSDESEILIALDRTQDIAASASHGTVTTAFNLRTDLASGGCPVSVVSACTSNTTNPTLGIELARAVKVGDVQGTAANALWGDLELLYEPRRPPFIVGPATLLVYWGGTVATTGFCQAQFVAFPSSKVKNLV